MECFLEDNPLQLGEVKVYSCSCGRLKYRDRLNVSLEDISNSVGKSIKVPYELKLTKIDVNPKLEEDKLVINVMVEGAYQGSRFKKNLSKKIKPEGFTCPTCSRKSSGYFEAVLQFRCKMPEVKIDESQIAKVEKVRGGLDYYILSNNYARSIASQLKRKGYSVKDSNQIYSRRDGREVYRVSYSIKEG